MTSTSVAAVDLGATSGRVVVGRVTSNSVDIDIVHRFANGPVRTIDGLHWGATSLFQHAVSGLSGAIGQQPDIASIGIDSWAVDYARIRAGRLVAEPFHYRDPRGADGVRIVHDVVQFEELFNRNGLQFLPFNTLYQLAAERAAAGLADVDRVLLVPDLFTWWLTGIEACEYTNATTTGLVDVVDRRWDIDLIDRLGFGRHLFADLVQPGDTLGLTQPSITERIGGRAIPVIAVASHDTASAVVATPMVDRNAAFISCGTWGLVGVEVDRPVLSAAARDAGFTNEGGVDGTHRFLHNVMGLWLLNESISTWREQGISEADLEISVLLASADAVTGPIAVFDTNEPRFLPPGDIPSRLRELCAERDLPVPTSRAAVVRSIIESLAQAFADTVRQAAALSSTTVRRVHLVGGGAMNSSLCQSTADRLELPVVAGPVEATAIGNVLIQARAIGAVSGGLGALRTIVAASTDLRTHTPSPQSAHRVD